MFFLRLHELKKCSALATLPKGLELTIRNADTCPAKTEALTTEQLFGGKRSVIFAVPGAFTPTCRFVYPTFRVVLSEMRLTRRPCC